MAQMSKIEKSISESFAEKEHSISLVNRSKMSLSGVNIQQTGSKFVFGADHFEDLGNMTTGYHKIKDDNILRGMELFSSAYRLLALLPIAKKVTQKILIFEKDEQSM